MRPALRARAALLLFALSAPALAEPEARQWLMRMGDALGSLEYQGVLVYVHDGRVDSMQVTRAIGPDGPREHIVSLNGDRREVVREGGSVRCASDGTVTNVLETAALPLARIDAARLAVDDSAYRLAVAGADRVAGHEATVIEARPRDADRYGYRLWLDSETAMPLASLLFAADGAMVEQMLFTSLSFGSRRVADGGTGLPGAAPAAPTAAPGFPVPTGFRLVAAPDGDGPRRHYLYSDGLATLSIYVEPLTPGEIALRGLQRRGAFSLVGRVDQGRQIMVVGDVPPGTAERIALAVDPLLAGR